MVMVMAFTVPSVPAHAGIYWESGKVTDKQGDTGCTWHYNHQTKVLTISGKGRLHGEINSDIIEENVDKIVVKEGITSIGKGFFDSYSMKNIRLPKSLKKIESNAFAYCFNLESIVIPKNVETLGWAAFHYCEELKSIRIMGNIEKAKGSFFSLWNLEKVVIAGNCDELGLMFRYCLSDKVKVKITKNNKYYVEKNGFVLSKDLKKLYFYNGSKKKAKLPETVTSIEWGACANKKINFTLNENLKRIKAYAFADCNIKEMICPDGLEQIENYAFADANVKKVVFNKDIKKIGDTAFHWAYVDKAIFNSDIPIGKENFDSETVLEYRNGAKMKTVMGNCFYRIRKGKKDIVSVFFAKVVGADGYQVKIFQPDKQKEKFYDVKSNSATIKTKFNIMTVENEWDALESDNCEEVYVRVRPFKNVNGKKVYGEWSGRALFEIY